MDGCSLHRFVDRMEGENSMKTSNQTEIRANIDDVFRAAAGVLDRSTARNRDEGFALIFEE